MAFLYPHREEKYAEVLGHYPDRVIAEHYVLHNFMAPDVTEFTRHLARRSRDGFDLPPIIDHHLVL